MKSIRGIILIALFVLMIVQQATTQDTENKLKSSNLSLSFNGTFIANRPVEQSNANSSDGRFWCAYDIGRVTDEVRISFESPEYQRAIK